MFWCMLGVMKKGGIAKMIKEGNCEHKLKLAHHLLVKIGDRKYEKWICGCCAKIIYLLPHFKTEKERRVELLEWIILDSKKEV